MVLIARKRYNITVPGGSLKELNNSTIVDCIKYKSNSQQTLTKLCYQQFVCTPVNN